MVGLHGFNLPSLANRGTMLGTVFIFKLIREVKLRVPTRLVGLTSVFQVDSLETIYRLS